MDDTRNFLGGRLEHIVGRLFRGRNGEQPLAPGPTEKENALKLALARQAPSNSLARFCKFSPNCTNRSSASGAREVRQSAYLAEASTKLIASEYSNGRPEDHRASPNAALICLALAVGEKARALIKESTGIGKN